MSIKRETMSLKRRGGESQACRNERSSKPVLTMTTTKVQKGGGLSQ